MPTVRITPSSYDLSNSSYLSVSNATNMYNNTDNDTYATVTNSRTSTTSYYIYLRDFDFSMVPSNAIVSSFIVKLKARESGVSTSTSYIPIIVNGTSTYSSAGEANSVIGTTASIITFEDPTTTWETLSNVSDFGIRINCRRASRNTTSYIYIYGAEIEVTYTIPNPATVTSTLIGSGTIVPSGAYETYEGGEYELTITPTNRSETVTATKNGLDITSELVAHGLGDTLSFSPESNTTSGISSGSQYAAYCIGHTAESPSSSGTSSNMYASSGSTGYASYSFDFSSIPSSAVIEGIEVRCYGHRESTTTDSSHMSQCILYSGSSAISEEVDFPSTSNSIITITPSESVTRAELDNVTVRHYVAYYGGLVLGITFEVTYSMGTDIDHYTYTYTVDGDATIVVTIGSPAQTDVLYVKSNGVWVAATKAYKKVNGVWVEQSDLTSVFSSGINYVKG